MNQIIQNLTKKELNFLFNHKKELWVNLYKLKNTCESSLNE